MDHLNFVIGEFQDMKMPPPGKGTSATYPSGHSSVIRRTAGGRVSGVIGFSITYPDRLDSS